MDIKNIKDMVIRYAAAKAKLIPHAKSRIILRNLKATKTTVKVDIIVLDYVNKTETRHNKCRILIADLE